MIGLPDEPRSDPSEDTEYTTRDETFENNASEDEEMDTTEKETDQASKLQDETNLALTEQLVASSPLKPQTGLPNVIFYNSRRDGWSVACRCFTFSENRGFLIYGHPKAQSSKWKVPLSRASRWEMSDHNMAFYYAQLLHRGLPATKSKEVAKWRLQSRIQINKRSVADLGMIKTRLFLVLSQNIEGMKSGVIKV